MNTYQKTGNQLVADLCDNPDSHALYLSSDLDYLCQTLHDNDLDLRYTLQDVDEGLDVWLGNNFTHVRYTNNTPQIQEDNGRCNMANLIKHLRLENGLTLDQCAKACDMGSRSTWLHIEQCDTEIKLKHMEKFCELIDMKLSELIRLYELL